jgi:hypothetical protein
MKRKRSKNILADL